jgi:hypothetical protein
LISWVLAASCNSIIVFYVGYKQNHMPMIHTSASRYVVVVGCFLSRVKRYNCIVMVFLIFFI